MRIEFEQGADNVGEYDSNGAIKVWPVRDCLGGTVPTLNRTNVTTKRIDATHFAVIPVGKDNGELEFVWKQPAVKVAVGKKEAE